jgi:hypothetical protein
VSPLSSLALGPYGIIGTVVSLMELLLAWLGCFEVVSFLVTGTNVSF